MSASHTNPSPGERRSLGRWPARRSLPRQRSTLAPQIRRAASRSACETRPLPHPATAARSRIGRAANRSADSGGHCNRSSEICSMGVANAKRLRGRSLSSSATVSRSVSVTVAKSVPLGKYWRSSPLVFSLGPRCHGAWGRRSRRRCRRSEPWSHVSSGVGPRAASRSSSRAPVRRARACSRRAAR
jgi:hypothetical protein